MSNRQAVIGCVLGTAVGDALGLPYEGLSPRRGRRLFGEPDRYRLLPGRGMVSDDTEHTCMAAESLLAAGDDPDAVAREFASRLRRWLLGLPAGIGWATLKATLKLWCGYSPWQSGVYSAGNGPAMRSAILGAAIDDLGLLKQIVRTSTRVTHTDPKAEYGAFAVALAAWLASRSSKVAAREYLGLLHEQLQDTGTNELHALLDRAVESVEGNEPTAQFASSLGLQQGVSGYVYHTVPVALHAWLRNQGQFRLGVIEIIKCGGDTDSTAAIVGGIMGCGVGRAGIPQEWLHGLWEWPRTVDWMHELASRLHGSRDSRRTGIPPRLSAVALMARNVFFAAIVLSHGLRRILPPY
ncbi:MAG: ADP-ribosylglycohydrolase family protein [Pirellulales bacterium]